jgi:hypothetical protein
MQIWIDSSAYGDTAIVHKNHRETAHRVHATQAKVNALLSAHIPLAGKADLTSYMYRFFFLGMC